MKLHYIALYDGKVSSGVTKKLLQQTASLNRAGLPASLVLVGYEDFAPPEGENLTYIPFTSTFKSGLFRKVFFYFGLKNGYTLALKQASPGDVILFRELISTPWFIFLVKKHYKDKFIFLESVSNGVQEALIRGGYFYSLLYRAISRLIPRYLHGLIGVTKEILEGGFGSSVGNKTVAVGNGFDVGTVTINNPIGGEFDRPVLRLTCVANVSVWHGLDRVIRGLERYGRDDVYLNIVGEGPEINNLKALAHECGVAGLVRFHGFQKGEALDDILGRTDLGIANLGTFRKRLRYTSPLKSREYCARGIPFVYSGIDEDFVDFPYALSIPGNAKPVNIDELWAFHARVNAVDGFRLAMAEYAGKNLTWDAKMAVVAGFIKSVVGQ